MAAVKIEAQPGPQTLFLSTSADIAIYGGAAGGGKTFGLLLEPLRHVTANRLFSALFLRRTTPQILNPGGLWDAASNLYPRAGAVPKPSFECFSTSSRPKPRATTNAPFSQLDAKSGPLSQCSPISWTTVLPGP